MATSNSNVDMLDMEDNELGSSIKQRALLRSRATTTINEVDKIIDTSNPNLDNLTTFVETLKGIVTDLNEVNAIIQNSFSDEALAQDDDKCFEYQVAINTTINSAKLIIKNLEEI
ncbi:UNVERIFIED_CONTAM: hypothetical protein RMT77_012695 [Armadillidium vulgare]